MSRVSLRHEMNRLRNVPCIDCVAAGRDGIWPIECMQFDHRNRDEKIDSIGHLAAAGKEEPFYAEIAKCDVICANCHAMCHSLTFGSTRQWSQIANNG